MKISGYLLLVLFTITLIQSQGQIKRNIYRTHIKSINGEIAKGYLFALDDSSIQIITTSKPHLDTSFPIVQIKKISLRKKNAIRKGFFIGMASGAVVGAGIGIDAYSEQVCEGIFPCIDLGLGISALAGAFIGTVSGGILGLATGTRYKKFVINGDIAKYNNFRNNTALLVNAGK